MIKHTHEHRAKVAQDSTRTDISDLDAIRPKRETFMAGKWQNT